MDNNKDRLVSSRLARRGRLLKDRMSTATGGALATERHRFMEVFVERFLEEWNGAREVQV